MHALIGGRGRDSCQPPPCRFSRMALRLELHRCHTSSRGTAFRLLEEPCNGVAKNEVVCSVRAPGATRRETPRCRTGAYLFTVCTMGPGSALHRYTLQRVRDTRSPPHSSAMALRIQLHRCHSRDR